MIALLAAALITVESGGAGLGDAVQAMQSGRLRQAKMILDAVVQAGGDGEQVERLFAEHAFLSRDWADAFARYQLLAARHPDEALTLERFGIAAFHVGDMARASAALTAATAIDGATWRAWNALGAVADLRSDWAEADRAYDQALELAPGSADVLNNRGWSLLLRGQWADAVPYLERAAELNPKSRRIADNLELVRAALAEDLPQRRPGESHTDWAARLNDAGVLAAAGGDRRRAIAALAQAIEASPQWFERAANNLAAIEAESAQ